MPGYLLEHLIRAGYLTETGLSRRARLRHCPTCGVYVMTGLDGDTCALEAVCDPRPLTAWGEAYAWLDGRRTWALTKPGRFELDPRTSREIAATPAGSQPRLDVLAQHACSVVDGRGRVRLLPVTCFGPSSFPETTPTLPPGSPAPF